MIYIFSLLVSKNKTQCKFSVTSHYSIFNQLSVKSNSRYSLTSHHSFGVFYNIALKLTLVKLKFKKNSKIFQSLLSTTFFNQPLFFHNVIFNIASKINLSNLKSKKNKFFSRFLDKNLKKMGFTGLKTYKSPKI